MRDLAYHSERVAVLYGLAFDNPFIKEASRYGNPETQADRRALLAMEAVRQYLGDPGRDA